MTMKNHRSARESMEFSELMKRYHGQIDNALYSAEILCIRSPIDNICREKRDCPFRYSTQSDSKMCHLYMLRKIIGDTI